MRRRDVLGTLIALGLSRSLDELAFEVAPQSAAGAHGTVPTGPTDIGTVGVQSVLRDLFPEGNRVEDDDYFGLQTEFLLLGFGELAGVKQFLERHRAHALEVEASAVQAIRAGVAKEALWLADPVRRRVAERGVFLSHVGLARTALINEFADRYRLCDTATLASRQPECA